MKFIINILLISIMYFPYFYSYADPVPMQGNGISHGLTGIGTLADANNPVEMELAPQYTRLIALRHRLTRKLSSATGHVLYLPPTLVSSAIELSDQTDRIRSQLDQLSKQPYDADFRMQVLAVQNSLTDAETNYDSFSRRIDAVIVEK